MNDIDAFVADLREAFSAEADPDRAEGMRAYLKNRFAFFGIGTEPRRRLLKAFVTQRGGWPKIEEARELSRRLWREPEREFHYCGQELLEKRSRLLTDEDLPLIEHLVTHQSWWDTVDFLATKLSGDILKRHRDRLVPATSRWLDSGNLWLQRTAILCQLKWKEDTDRAVLVEAIERTRGSSEFFLRKAIGWSLREVAKTDPDWVRDFVDRTELSPLSRREALKHL